MGVCQRINQFFLVVSPPFEEFALKELREKLPEAKELSIEKGGLSFSAPLLDAISVQKYLKVPTRLLLRVFEGRIRDLPKLYQKVQKLPWNDYLVQQAYELQVDCKSSRLNNEKKVATCIEDGLKAYWRANQAPKHDFKYTHRIWVRFANDLCSLSIDCSGEALYKRTGEKMSVIAPLRETYSYSLLSIFKDKFDKQTRLIDPMCGSGSFASELIYWGQVLKREVAAEFFSCVKKTKESLRDFDFPGLAFKEIYLNDISEKSIEAAQANIPTDRDASFYNKDITEFLAEIDTKNSVIITNMPYGKRLKEEIHFSAWVQSLSNTKAKAVGFLAPADLKLSGLKEWKMLPFINGGVKVSFYYLFK